MLFFGAEIDLWMIGFWMMYFLFLYALYIHYGQRFLNKIRYGPYFCHYHVLDTGENGDHVFKNGLNYVRGVPRIFHLDLVEYGTVWYDSDNVEPVSTEKQLMPAEILIEKASKPVTMERSKGNLLGGKYEYFCHTKNFDIITKNDVLETFLILKAKDIIMLLIGIGIVVTLAAAVINYLTVTGLHTDLQASIEGLKPLINKSVSSGAYNPPMVTIANVTVGNP